MRVMISTVHIQQAVLAAIPKLSPEKIIFLVDDKTKKKSELTEIKKIYSAIIPMEELPVNSYDIVNVAQILVKKIEDEFSKGNEIVLHITEGRKTLAIAAMYASYSRKKMVKGIYYITEENNELISLPVLEISMTTTKKQILQEFLKGNTDIKKLAKLSGKTEAMIYAHISDLKGEGYISQDDKVTDAGRIVVM